MAQDAQKASPCSSFFKRLRTLFGDKSGESLVETLVSTLIVVAVFLMLCTAVVSAAKVNTSIKPGDTVFDASESSVLQGASVTVRGENSSESSTQSISAHVSDNGYVYYE